MHSSLVRRAVALGAAVLLGAGLAGCADDNRGDGDDTAKAGSATPGAQSLDLTEPIPGAEAEYTVPGTTNDRVTVSVLLLETQGDLQMLHLAFTPHFASRAKDDEVGLADMLDVKAYSADFAPRLLDRDNLKIYSAVRASPDESKTTNGKPLYVYAAFAAPQDDNVKTYDLSILPEWQNIIVEVPQS